MRRLVLSHVGAGVVASLVTFLCCSATGTLRADTLSPSDEQSSQALVREALLAELDGNNDLRNTLLEQTIQRWPDDEPARWLAGQVQHEGKWLEIEQAQQRAEWDLLNAQYLQMRDVARQPQQQLALARWADRNQQPDRARLHYYQVLYNVQSPEDARREAAQRLELRLVDGQWLTADALQAYLQLKQKLDQSLNRWLPRIDSWQQSLQSDRQRVVRSVQSQLDSVEDLAGLAIAVRLKAARINDPLGRMLIQRLSESKSAEAAEALTELALSSPSPTIRNNALVVLRERRLEDSVPYLLRRLADPIRSQCAILWDAEGRVLYTHDFLQSGEQANELARVQHMALPRPRIVNDLAATSNDPIENAVQGRIARDLLVLNIAARAMQLEVGTTNRNLIVAENNRRIADVLEELVGVRLEPTREAWQVWWDDYRETYRPEYPRPVYVVNYPTSSTYSGGPIHHVPLPNYISPSCFLTGTPVWTETGLRPVESIRPGDRVLSRDADSGRLKFELVLDTTIRPTSRAMEIRMEGESLRATGGHCFWVSGAGWKMVKQVEVGQRLHGLRGSMEVLQVDPLSDEDQAYNLVVDRTHTYFVGQQGLLVHDNTLEPSSECLVPGLVAER